MTLIQVLLCNIHRTQELEPIDGDFAMLCPNGHIVEDGKWITAKREKKVMPQEPRSIPPSASLRSPVDPLKTVVVERTKQEDPRLAPPPVVKPKAAKYSKTVLMSTALYTKLGARLFISLEKATMIPFKVMRKHVDLEGTSSTGITDRCLDAAEGERKYKDRVAGAVKIGWSIGNPSTEAQLVDIPKPDDKAIPRRRKKAKK